MSPFHIDWPIMFKYTFSISIVFWFLSVHDYCQILRNIVDTSTLYSPVELSTDQFLLCLSQLAISSYFSSGSCWRGISLLSVGNILPAGGGEIGVWPDPASSLFFIHSTLLLLLLVSTSTTRESLGKVESWASEAVTSRQSAAASNQSTGGKC